MFVPDTQALGGKGYQHFEAFRREVFVAMPDAARVAVVLRRWYTPEAVAPGCTLRDVMVATEYAVIAEAYARAERTPSRRFAENRAAAELILRGERDAALKRMSPISAALYWAERENPMWATPWHECIITGDDVPIEERLDDMAAKAKAKVAAKAKAKAEVEGKGPEGGEGCDSSGHSYLVRV